MAHSAPTTATSLSLGGPLQMAALRLFERLSLRPKTATAIPVLAGLGIGALYSFNTFPVKTVGDMMNKKRRSSDERLWDFYDPQGHHKIDWE